MVLAMTICLAALCCVLSVFLSWRYIQKTYAAIDTIFDSILAQKAGLSFETELDSRLSKLTHKAIKIVQMNSADVVQLGQEKQTIQSLLSDMSHQMKTPLSSISMYIDLLLEGNLSSGEQREFFTRIKAGTEKLGWLMDSLIKMSRLEVGAIELAPVPAGIKQTISDSISMVLAAAAKKNISIQAEPFMDTPLLHDRKWTVEAMANVLENAVGYRRLMNDFGNGGFLVPLFQKQLHAHGEDPLFSGQAGTGNGRGDHILSMHYGMHAIIVSDVSGKCNRGQKNIHSYCAPAGTFSAGRRLKK